MSRQILTSLAALAFCTSLGWADEVPGELTGHWGEDSHCAAQADAGVDAVVESAGDAPYRFEGQWISRWHFYCRVLRLDDFGERDGAQTWRARVLCGEDTVERPYELDLVRRGDTLSLTWLAMDENGRFLEPWNSGPFRQCTPPQS
ncbi:MAG: hypothetical protein AAF739_15330 [Pseudomonadota bacterium]